VTAVHLEPGEWAPPGYAVVELAGDGALEIPVEVPESAVGRLAVGQKVSVTLPFVGLEIQGEITRLSSVSLGAGGLFPVEVRLETRPGLAAGLAADVVLPLEAEPALTVPLKSVLNPGSSNPSVFRIVDGRAERVAVRPGQLLGDRIVVEGPLAAGDRVAVAGHTALADGDPVEVF
jgi:multidrug efflux pump subunit AcrA (membrane-fusion protein)